MQRKLFYRVGIFCFAALLVACGGQGSGTSSGSAGGGTGNPPPVDAGFDYYLTGNAANVVSSTEAGTVLMGGGSDVDAAFRWQIARSGGGDFVVIRAAGADGYNDYINKLDHVDSVETLVIRTRTAASDAFVLERIKNADALFIAGGDQQQYLQLWQGTPVQTAIAELMHRGVPVGGTSAGLAVLGQFVYSAEHESAESPAALADPYYPDMTFTRDFIALPLLHDLITDSHFAQRDRMGRLVSFLARLNQDGWTNSARGLGIDEATALLMDEFGNASVVGNGAAYFLTAPGMPQDCRPHTPLTILNISVQRLRGGDSFDVAQWHGTQGSSYLLNAQRGTLISTQTDLSIY